MSGGRAPHHPTADGQAHKQSMPIVWKLIPPSSPRPPRRQFLLFYLFLHFYSSFIILRSHDIILNQCQTVFIIVPYQKKRLYIISFSYLGVYQFFCSKINFILIPKYARFFFYVCGHVSVVHGITENQFSNRYGKRICNGLQQSRVSYTNNLLL